METEYWILLAYVVGSIFSYRWGYRKGILDASNHAIDALMAQGIIRYSRDSQGEIQIHKWDEDESPKEVDSNAK